MYKVVHPAQACFDVPWLPENAYDGRECLLEVFEFRRGSPWALKKRQQELGSVGDVVVLSGPVKLQPIEKFARPGQLGQAQPVM